MQSSKIAAVSLIALSSLAAGSVFAADLTRQQVQAEYLQAAKAGTLPSYIDGQISNLPAVASSKTRAQVQAEYFDAVKNGTLPQTVDGAPAPAAERAPGSAQRSDVRADYLKALHDGTLPKYENS